MFQQPQGPITRAAQQFQNPLAGDSIKPPAQRNPLSTMMQDPTISGFADGGEIKETPSQLIARMNAKYGLGTGAAAPDPAPVAQPAPQPAPAQNTGGIGRLIGLLKGRKDQIDKAAGYAGGGKIKGPGTPTSDSIPAQVQQTGEPIKVSTDERIVSAAQDALLQKLAKDLGFPSLDAMLEAGTGQPVGPTIKSGSTAAAFGATTEDDPYEKSSGGQVSANPMSGVIKTGTSSYTQDLSTSQPAAASTPAPAALPPVVRDSFGNDMTRTNTMKAQLGEPAVTAPSPARNAMAASAPQAQPLPETANVSALQATPTGNGEAAAGSISRAVPVSDQPQANVNPLPSVLSGGRMSSIDLAGSNASLANANAIRQSLIDSQAGARSEPGSSGGVIANSGLAETNALMDKWGRETQMQEAFRAMERNPKNAQAIAALVGANQHSEATRVGQTLGAETARATDATHRQGQTLAANTAIRGQDVTAQTHANQLAGNPLDNLLKQTQVDTGKVGIDKTKQHIDDVAKLNAETNPEKRQAMIENLLTAQGKNVAPAERLTLPMQRSNAEIDAARKMVAGLSQEEIRRRTAKQTNTGRDNPDFDQTLEHAVNLSNRRKVGVDDHFDQRLQQATQAQPPQGTDGDAITRFKADPTMKGHAPGKQTANGTEVLDSTGKLIGYYQ